MEAEKIPIEKTERNFELLSKNAKNVEKSSCQKAGRIFVSTILLLILIGLGFYCWFAKDVSLLVILVSIVIMLLIVAYCYIMNKNHKKPKIIQKSTEENAKASNPDLKRDSEIFTIEDEIMKIEVTKSENDCESPIGVGLKTSRRCWDLNNHEYHLNQNDCVNIL